MPSNKNTFEGGADSLLAEFVDDMDKMFHPQTMDFYEHTRVLEKIAKGIQAIIIEKKTPTQVADEVQALKKSLMKK